MRLKLLKLEFSKSPMLDQRMWYLPDCINETNITEDEVVQDCTIPIFTRIRTVTVDTCGTMACSCCLFERQGLLCTHQACVAVLCHELVGSTFPGFTHHDINVR